MEERQSVDVNIKDLKVCFDCAIKNKSDFIAVVIATEGVAGNEIIINPNENLQSKLEYYKKAYNDDLILKTYNGIKIVGFAHGNMQEIIDSLDLI